MTHGKHGCVALAVLAAATLLSVQGCGTGTPAQAIPVARAAVTPDQAQAVYQSYLQISDSAAAAGASIPGLSVVTNAAWQATHAQFAAMDATGQPVQQLAYGTPQFLVPRQDGFPHWFMVSVPTRPAKAPASASITTLMVFSQASSGATWTLAGAAGLGTGQSLPALARDKSGYLTALPSDDQSLLVRPDIVGATQAAVVDDGPASPAAALVATGASTTGMYSEHSGLAKAAAAQRLQYTWLMLGTYYPVYALRTASGGALVLYGMFLNTITQYPNLVAGSAISIPAGIRPLIPPGQIAYHAYYANWTYEFAAVDPPASTPSARVTIIAATGSLTTAHAY